MTINGVVAWRSNNPALPAAFLILEGFAVGSVGLWLTFASSVKRAAAVPPDRAADAIGRSAPAAAGAR
ncbi:MAG: hypothetical protein WBD71_03540 [Xanthobacteraceae bacterium]